MQSASGTLKRVTLELGGNDPAIVCEDVDIESTAQKVKIPAVPLSLKLSISNPRYQIVTLAFKNSGQICIALKRIYIQDTIYTPFRDAMVRFTQELRVGNGLDPNTTHGPLQNEMQYDRVRGFFKDMECQKWCIATGGLNDENAEGYFITPTIIDNPSDNSRIVVEEPFGLFLSPRFFPFFSTTTQSSTYAHLFPLLIETIYRTDRADLILAL